MSKVVYTPNACRYQVQRCEYDGSWIVYEVYNTLEDACDSADMNASVVPYHQWRVVDMEED